MATLAPHIAVAVPSMGLWHSTFGKCLTMLMLAAQGSPLAGVKSQRISLLTAEGSMLPQNRHNLVVKALQSGCTHLLFLDSDMQFPANLLHRLWKRKKQFIAANCTTRRFPTNATAHLLDGSIAESRGKVGVERVRQVGLAVALFELAPIKQLTPPLFSMEWVDAFNAYCGEDVYFCAKLGEQGVELWIDHEVSPDIYHIGSYAYGHSDIDNTKVRVRNNA